MHALLDRDLSGREDILGRAGELGIDLVEGASIVVARAHSHVPTEDGWRQRVLGRPGSPPWQSQLSHGGSRRGGGQDDDHDERLDLGRPAGRAARPEVPQASATTASASSCSRAAPTSASPTSPHGRVTIGNSSRDPKPTDPGGLVFNKIAHDAICIITNNANPLPNLDQAGVQAIFGGSVRSWSQVPGATADTARSTCSSAPPASGTQDAFQKIFMGPHEQSSSAPARRHRTGWSSRRSRATRTAIGYVSLFFTKGVHAIPYKGVACTLRNAKSGQYGGVRNFYMVTRGAPTGAAAKWINWITHSKAAEQDHRHPVGAAALDEQPDGSQQRGAEGPHRPARRASCSARWRAAVLLLIAGMIVFVFAKAWPSFAHNGLAWFGPGGNVDEQLTNIFNSPAEPERLRLHASRLAADLRDGADHRRRGRCSATAIALLSAMFIVEFAPDGDAPRSCEPVVRLLAAVPSVIYGLIGILVLVPFVGNHLISSAAEGLGRAT